MNKIYAILFFSLCVSVAFAQDTCPIIPQPLSVQRNHGAFILNNNISIQTSNKQMLSVANYLQSELLQSIHIAVPLNLQDNKQRTIILEYKGGLNNEEYILSISPAAIIISGRDNVALFNGINSLLQLILCNNTLEQGKPLVQVDCWLIKDKPRYQWRGLMVDESRHFFGKQEIEKILNWMAFYKLNKFHWHLTDGSGWRLEIKNYPKLALIGGIGNNTDTNARASFYTQQDIEEIVSYAKERFITIIPEIDMPGHATAANRAYPEFSGGGSKKFPDFTFNPGKEGTYAYLMGIIREVDALFPSQMIHIGGDEVHFGNENWITKPEVNTLMKQNKLPDISAVEKYFDRRMADSVISLNNKVLAWDEDVEVGIPKDKSIIFWWRQDKPQILDKALSNGYQVVLCPRRPFYLNYSQDSLHVHGPFNGKQTNTSPDVYNFSLPKMSSGINNGQVLGLQVNLWTELVETNQRLEFLLFPRLAALAENAWTADKRKNYDDFKNRLALHYKLYDLMRLYYYNLTYPAKNGEPVR